MPCVSWRVCLVDLAAKPHRGPNRLSTAHSTSRKAIGGHGPYKVKYDISRLFARVILLPTMINDTPSRFVPPGHNSVSGGYAAPMSPETRNFAGTVSRNTGDAWRTLLSCGAAHAAARGREAACTRARACCRRGHPALQPAIAARARLAHPPWAARTGPRRPSCSRAFGQALVPARRLWKSARQAARRGWGRQTARVGGPSRRPAR